MIHKIILLFVLGSHIPYLHNSRIDDAISFYQDRCQNQTCFLINLGRNYKAHHSELYIETQNFLNQIDNTKNAIYDETSQNTAENAFCANQIANSFDNPEIYVFTNLFHKERVRILFDHYMIEPYNIITNERSCSYCQSDEISHHLKNINKDIYDMKLSRCSFNTLFV